MNFFHEGTVSLIVGANSGIGFAVANRLSQREGTVILAGRNQEKLDRAVNRLSDSRAKLQTLSIDTSKEESVKAALDSLDQIDHVVYTAGSSAPGGKLSDLSIADAMDGFQTKFWGAIRVVKIAAPKIRDKGSITLTTGVVARKFIPGAFVKTAMNSALEASVKLLAKEYAPLRINAVSPGITDTEAYAGMEENARKTMLENTAGSLPVGRIGKADDVAAGYEFFIDNPQVTGTVIDIEGGALL